MLFGRRCFRRLYICALGVARARELAGARVFSSSLGIFVCNLGAGYMWELLGGGKV